MLPEVRSRDPIEITCPNCKEEITTKTEKRMSSDQLCSILLMALGTILILRQRKDWVDGFIK
jgi:hypothetical protein